MSFTVVPIHNLSLPSGSLIPFGNDVVLQDVPEWLKRDKGTLHRLSEEERTSTLDSTHAWVASYDAKAIGEPDPRWKGSTQKSIQELKLDSIVVANFAMWLILP
jgi:hypothetical protein